jgi:hypothetical protein
MRHDCNFAFTVTRCDPGTEFISRAVTLVGKLQEPPSSSVTATQTVRPRTMMMMTHHTKGV